jgi:hypothetical protein
MSVAFWTASVTGIYQYFHQIREFIHTFNRDRGTVERRLAHLPTTAATSSPRPVAAATLAAGQLRRLANNYHVRPTEYAMGFHRVVD